MVGKVGPRLYGVLSLVVEVISDKVSGDSHDHGVAAMLLHCSQHLSHLFTKFGTCVSCISEGAQVVAVDIL